MIKPLITNEIKMEKSLYPTHPVRGIVTRHSECGKNSFCNKVSFKLF